MKRKLNGPLVLGLLLALGLMGLVIAAHFVVLPVAPKESLGSFLARETKPLPPGTPGHLLGTTKYGADVLTMLLLTAWPTLSVGLVIMLGRALLGIPLGLLAGWSGRRLGRLVGVLASVFTAVPTMIVAIVATRAISAIFSTGTYVPAWWSTYVVLILAGFPRLAQQVRLLTEEIKRRPYMESATAAGASTWRTLYRYVLPAMYGDLLVTLSAEIAWVLMLCAQMAVFDTYIANNWASAFGAGLWSLRTTPWVALFPALALGLAVACFQLLAEGLRRLWVERI
ncbi:MAG: ABC transporter permease [Mycobacterium leprae]